MVKPNALVAHLRDGVEILHLYTGRPLCRLSLKRDVLHADINSDGVIDHLEPVAGVYTPFSAASADQTQRRLRSQEPKCRAQATSAIPPTHQVRVCQSRALCIYH